MLQLTSLPTFMIWLENTNTCIWVVVSTILLLIVNFVHSWIFFDSDVTTCVSCACAESELRQRGEGPDASHPDSADGDVEDSRAPERPRDADRPAVQPRQVLHEHARTAQDVAGEHGAETHRLPQLLRGQCWHRRSVAWGREWGARPTRVRPSCGRRGWRTWRRNTSPTTTTQRSVPPPPPPPQRRSLGWGRAGRDCIGVWAQTDTVRQSCWIVAVILNYLWYLSYSSFYNALLHIMCTSAC